MHSALSTHHQTLPSCTSHMRIHTHERTHTNTCAHNAITAIASVIHIYKKGESFFCRCFIAFGFILLLWRYMKQTYNVGWADLCPQYHIHIHIITFMLAPLFLFCAEHVFGPSLLLCFRLLLSFHVLYASLSFSFAIAIFHFLLFLPPFFHFIFRICLFKWVYLKLLHRINIHIRIFQSVLDAPDFNHYV